MGSVGAAEPPSARLTSVERVLQSELSSQFGQMPGRDRRYTKEPRAYGTLAVKARGYGRGASALHELAVPQGR
jgi:hypothetical protein